MTINKPSLSRVHNFLMATAASLVLFIMLAAFYIAYIAGPSLRLQNLPIPVVNDVFAGESVIMAVEVCNVTSTTKIYTSTKQLINPLTNVKTVLPSSDTSVDPGCHRYQNRATTIPKTTPPGTYLVRGIVLVENSLRAREVEWYTERFDVLPMRPAVVITLPGIPGAPGPAGPPGKSVKGKDGEKGSTGATGATGAKGNGFWGK